MDAYCLNIDTIQYVQKLSIYVFIINCSVQCIALGNIHQGDVDTLNICDKERFPNIFVLLQIGCSLPVTSCSCERGASTLKRLRTYMRASMTEQRLTGLALLHIHYDIKVDLELVVDNFAKRNPRKMDLKNLIFDC